MTPPHRLRRAAHALAALVSLAGAAAPAAARPTYFAVLTETFGIQEGDRLHACGVCHLRWEGTGARNPFGASVEQQLYLGKPIAQAIADAVGEDPDADGYTSLEELQTYKTLPGFSCANFFDAIGAPADWHTFITPNVPSCLEPKDVRAAPTQITFATLVGTVDTETVRIINNGSTDPILVTGYALANGTDPSITLEGRTPPFTLAVDQEESIQIHFAPGALVFESSSLEIESDDPDEPVVAVPVNALSILRPVADAERRAACFVQLAGAVERYTQADLAAVSKCALDEARGIACRSGRRDIALLRAEAKLRESLGGRRDERCEGAGLSPGLLGHPERCGGGCSAIELDEFADLADCLVCRQRELGDALLGALLGATPPDLPPIAPTRSAARCQSGLVSAARRAVGRTQSLLAQCALSNLSAQTPVDCQEANATAVAELGDDLAARLARCPDAAQLEGCFAGGGDPGCLGAAAVESGNGMVETTFGLGD